MITLVQGRAWLACFVAAACLFTLCHGSIVDELDEKTWDRMMTGEWMVEL